MKKHSYKYKDRQVVQELESLYKKYYNGQLTHLKFSPFYNKDRVKYPYTVYWDGTDRKDTWDQYSTTGKVPGYVIKSLNINGVKNEINLQPIIKKYTDRPIEYIHNSYSFRDQEFPTDESINGAFGCSFTFGTGLHQEETWPSILSDRLGKKVWNFGLGGSGILTQLRIFLYFVEKLDFDNIFLYSPSNQVRWEWQSWDYKHDTEFYELWTPHRTNCSEELSIALGNPSNYTFMSFMAMMTFAKVCKDRNINFYVISAEDPVVSTDFRTDFSFFPDEEVPILFARDLQHYGTFFHESITEIFLKKIRNKLVF